MAGIVLGRGASERGLHPNGASRKSARQKRKGSGLYFNVFTKALHNVRRVAGHRMRRSVCSHKNGKRFFPLYIRRMGRCGVKNILRNSCAIRSSKRLSNVRQVTDLHPGEAADCSNKTWRSEILDEGFQICCRAEKDMQACGIRNV